jgi:hypothetical protein
MRGRFSNRCSAKGSPLFKFSRPVPEIVSGRKSIPFTLGGGLAAPEFLVALDTTSPTLPALDWQLPKKSTSMAAGVAKGNLKTCHLTTTSGIWRIA